MILDYMHSANFLRGYKPYPITLPASSLIPRSYPHLCPSDTVFSHDGCASLFHEIVRGLTTGTLAYLPLCVSTHVCGMNE